MLLDLVFAEPATPDSGRRTLSGTAVPFGVPSGPTANGNRYRFHAGPDNADEAIDVVREHDADAVVGRLSAWAPVDTGLGATARLFSTTAGNDALIEATEQVRTGFSVGADADDDQLTLADDGVYDVGNWTATHLGLVRRPAFADATITRIAASSEVEKPEDPDPDDDEDQDEDTTDTDDDGTADDEPDQEETMPDQTIEAAAQVPTEHRGRRTITGARAPKTVDEAAHVIAAAAQRHNVMQGETDIGRINAALSDVIPGDGTNGLGGVFLRPQWIDELWTPEYSQRNFVDAVGTSPLTSMTWQGWKWGTKPEVAKYTGNKTPIPSNPVTIVPATGTAYRIAGGWDIDRIFIDLGSPDFVAAMFTAATADYSMKSEQFLGAALLAGATVGTAAASLVEALNVAAQTLTAAGASMTFVAMATDLWSEFLMLPESEVPWWLRNQATINLAGATTTIAGVSVFTDPSLPDGTLLAGDRKAVDFRDSGPIRVQAVNIPNGGIDIALFGYQGEIIQDARGLVSVAVATLPLSTRGGSSKK
ncbi:MAG TPA: hypothetical protein VNN79_07405 [Actinomycetota bacterium]|nr:hypothetical protein [Actinomycetota bacterium]